MASFHTHTWCLFGFLYSYMRTDRDAIRLQHDMHTHTHNTNTRCVSLSSGSTAAPSQLCSEVLGWEVGVVFVCVCLGRGVLLTNRLPWPPKQGFLAASLLPASSLHFAPFFLTLLLQHFPARPDFSTCTSTHTQA